MHLNITLYFIIGIILGSLYHYYTEKKILQSSYINNDLGTVLFVFIWPLLLLTASPFILVEVYERIIKSDVYKKIKQIFRKK